jgi:hypothetical protein
MEGKAHAVCCAGAGILRGIVQDVVLAALGSIVISFVLASMQISEIALLK